MRILDKTISNAAWEQMTQEQRDRLATAGLLAEWMFRQSVILTVCDDDGNVQQLDGTLPPVGEVELVAEAVKPTLGERVRTLFVKKEAD